MVCAVSGTPRNTLHLFNMYPYCMATYLGNFRGNPHLYFKSQQHNHWEGENVGKEPGAFYPVAGTDQATQRVFLGSPSF